MKKLFILLTLAILLNPTDSFAKKYNLRTANGLLDACKNVIAEEAGEEFDWNGHGQCFGYFRGVKDSYDIQNMTSKRTGKICVPKSATWLQLIKIFVKWTDDHPEKLNDFAWTGVVLSMSSVYKCAGA